MNCARKILEELKKKNLEIVQPQINVNNGLNMFLLIQKFTHKIINQIKETRKHKIKLMKKKKKRVKLINRGA